MGGLTCIGKQGAVGQCLCLRPGCGCRGSTVRESLFLMPPRWLSLTRRTNASEPVTVMPARLRDQMLVRRCGGLQLLPRRPVSREEHAVSAIRRLQRASAPWPFQAHLNVRPSFVSTDLDSGPGNGAKIWDHCWLVNGQTNPTLRLFGPRRLHTGRRALRSALWKH